MTSQSLQSGSPLDLPCSALTRAVSVSQACLQIHYARNFELFSTCGRCAPPQQPRQCCSLAPRPPPTAAAAVLAKHRLVYFAPMAGLQCCSRRRCTPAGCCRMMAPQRPAVSLHQRSALLRFPSGATTGAQRQQMRCNACLPAPCRPWGAHVEPGQAEDISKAHETHAVRAEQGVSSWAGRSGQSAIS